MPDAWCRRFEKEAELDDSKGNERERPTAALVARHAKVSRVAVSRAFNANASIRPEKRDLILKVAREIGYVPDMAARSMVTGRSNLIAVIVPDLASPWESQELDALTLALQDLGFAMLLFRTGDDFTLDDRLLAYLRGFNPDSVICYAENVRPRLLDRSLDRAVPIYISYPEAALSEPHETPVKYDCLEVMLEDALAEIVDRMVARGARQFAFLAGKSGSAATSARRQILSRILKRAGLPDPIEIAGDYGYEMAYRSTAARFRSGHEINAIIAANDVSACGAIDALRCEIELRVPDQVQVAGYDDVGLAHWKSHDLTTVRVDLAERVAALTQLIQRRLAGLEAPGLTERIASHPVFRRSAG
jgi:DNA-binding LacI/PurR family transcriptional regulator